MMAGIMNLPTLALGLLFAQGTSIADLRYAEEKDPHKEK